MKADEQEKFFSMEMKIIFDAILVLLFAFKYGGKRREDELMVFAVLLNFSRMFWEQKNGEKNYLNLERDFKVALTEKNKRDPKKFFHEQVSPL